jgi:hypothetical protein
VVIARVAAANLSTAAVRVAIAVEVDCIHDSVENLMLSAGWDIGGESLR